MFKICKNADCKKQFTPKYSSQIYCSHSCAAHVNNRGVRRHGKDPGKCKVCGEPLESYERSFCSMKCFNTSRLSEKVREWKDGTWDGSEGKGGCLSATIRKYLLNKANNKCSSCGWGETNKYTGLVPLQIHHVDGNFKNNKEDNLQVLCPNCHSLTNNFGARQKAFTGNSRRAKKVK